MCKETGSRGLIVLVAGVGLWFSGCATHADLVGLRDHLATVSKSQDQDQKRLDSLQRRLESLERVKDSESPKQKLDPRFDELSARVQKLEGRLAKLDETSGAPAVSKVEPTPGEAARPSKPQRPASAADVPTMTPG